jgi:hypothetical protein
VNGADTSGLVRGGVRPLTNYPERRRPRHDRATEASASVADRGHSEWWRDGTVTDLVRVAVASGASRACSRRAMCSHGSEAGAVVACTGGVSLEEEVRPRDALDRRRPARPWLANARSVELPNRNVGPVWADLATRLNMPTGGRRSNTILTATPIRIPRSG